MFEFLKELPPLAQLILGLVFGACAVVHMLALESYFNRLTEGILVVAGFMLAAWFLLGIVEVNV